MLKDSYLSIFLLFLGIIWASPQSLEFHHLSQVWVSLRILECSPLSMILGVEFLLICEIEETSSSTPHPWHSRWQKHRVIFGDIPIQKGGMGNGSTKSHQITVIRKHNWANIGGSFIRTQFCFCSAVILLGFWFHSLGSWFHSLSHLVIVMIGSLCLQVRSSLSLPLACRC